MKILIVGDLHGAKPNIHYKEFDAIIAPGDFCSSEARPYMFQALKKELETGRTHYWYDIAGKEKAKEIIEKSLKDGRAILEYLNSIGVPVYAVPGNNDWTPSEEADWDFVKKDRYPELIEGLDNVIDVHHKIVDADGYQIIGHGIISGPEYPQYPEDIKKAENEGTLETKKQKYERDKKKVEELFRKATKPVIFLPHNVPFNTPIDKINNPHSPRNGQHFGSLIAREIIDKHQPLACIGGHMHEYHEKCMVGKTVCINAGFGAEVNTLLELENGKVKKVEFYNAK